MNRYSYTQDYSAPRHIFKGDIYTMRGTNLHCEVAVASETDVSYIMYRTAFTAEQEVANMPRAEFLKKFEFFEHEGQLPRMQQEHEEYDNNEERFEYWNDDYFDEDGYE